MKKIVVLISLILFTVSPLKAQWQQLNFPNQIIKCFAMSGSNIFVSTIGVANIYLSTDNGTNWVPANGNLGARNISAITLAGSNLFLGSFDGVFKSTNNGTNWVSVNNGLPNFLDVGGFAVLGSNIFVGTNYGVYLSSNQGTNWTSVSNGLTHPSVYTFLVSGTTLFAGTYYGVFKSTNNGTNWLPANDGMSNSAVHTLAMIGANLFAGSWTSSLDSSNIYMSTNFGGNWIKVKNGLPASDVYALAVSGTTLFAAMGKIVCPEAPGGVFMSSNNGTTWINKNQGFNNPCIYALLITNSSIFAGTNSQGIWKRSISEIIGIQNVSSELPREYKLYQNYPNPFNPNTNIEFSISKKSLVELIIFDVKGKEISKLVNGNLEAGVYRYNYDGSHLSSGVYFYKLITENFSQTRKMILLK